MAFLIFKKGAKNTYKPPAQNCDFDKGVHNCNIGLLGRNLHSVHAENIHCKRN